MLILQYAQLINILTAPWRSKHAPVTSYIHLAHIKEISKEPLQSDNMREFSNLSLCLPFYSSDE